MTYPNGSPWVYYQNGDNVHGPLVKYHIPRGTVIMRFRDTGISPENIITSKDVTFDEFDLIGISYHAMDDYPGTPNTDNPRNYTFLLPDSAAPYTQIRVDARYVQKT